ncbi:MAG: VWA domain-containing protein [Candidatus Aenigmarchaeota archaeon]|nr:VWA domain-containing protein [Candidatus Aenigmarchaeota archaeon]
MEMKKGFVFTMDVLIGLGLIMIIFIFAFLEFGSVLSEKRYQKLNFVAEDTMDLLVFLEVKDVKDKPIISQLIDEGVITEEDMEKSVLDLIAGFWYKNNKTIAGNITKEVLGEIIDVVNIQLSVDGESIYSSSDIPAREVAVASRIESGYEPGKPTYGYIARAFLTRIRGKRDSSYVYFGGYVGEGNITRNITLPPFEKILEAYMELDVGNNFTLYINGNYSGFYMNGSAGGGQMRADKWVVCNATYYPYYCSNFTVGNNTLSFNFVGNGSFIGGGYFRVTYNTTQLAPEEEVGKDKYWFPGIGGIINLYDSFYVPGDLYGMNVHLHYRNNFTTYLVIGNKTVHEDNSTNERIVDLANGTLSTLLNYNELSKKTIPIRLGTKAFFGEKVGNADVILITDLSGSMNWQLNSSNKGNDITVCGDLNDPNNPIFAPTTSRISLARCLDKDFTEIILNASGNRVGLVAYRDSTYSYHNLSTNKAELFNQINSYTANGGTCICCGINKAYEILNAQSNETRDKFLILMSDGIPSHKCSSTGCEGNSATGFFERDCYGWGCCCPADPVTGQGCDTSFGWCSSPSIGCRLCRCMCEMQNANYSSCRVHNNLNAIVHSVGFGPVATCPMGNWTLRAIANCGGGSYNASTDAEGLKEIYRKFAENIVNISYHAQMVDVTGNVPLNNTLYPDSCIEFQYSPILIPYEYGEISLTRETARLKEMSGDTVDVPYKEGWFNVSDQVKIVDAKITSYSSEYWTDRVYVKSSATDWNNVYWLGSYGNNYQKLGDPYVIQIPIDLIASGNNSIRIGTGITPNNATGGSPDDRVVYTIRVSGSVGFGEVFNTSENATGDANRRLRNLAQDYVDFTSEDIRVENKTIKGIQWLWGPSLLSLSIWSR